MTTCEALRHRRPPGGHGADPGGRDAPLRRARRPVACRWATKAAAWWCGRRVADSAGAARQDGRHDRRRDVRAVPHREGASQCLVLPAGATPAEGASCFVNPLTALGMVETMRARGPHGAGAHRRGVEPRARCSTASASPTACRWSTSCASPSRPSCCARIGAVHVCDSSAPTFMDDLTAALVATGATHRVRRHRRRHARRPDPDRAWRPRPTAKADELQPLRLDDAQAGLHLRRPRPQPDRVRRAASAWRGASAAGCSRRSCRRSARRRRTACASAWRASSRPPSPATTPHEVSLAEALRARRPSPSTRKQATGEKFLVRPTLG